MVDLLISWLFYEIFDFFAMLNSENIAMSRNIFQKLLELFLPTNWTKYFALEKWAPQENFDFKEPLL